VHFGLERQNRIKEGTLESNIHQEAGQQPFSAPRLVTSDDREALSRVFGTQRQRLFYAALRLLGNAEDAEDAVQDGLLAALRNLQRFERRAQLSTWLTRIVVNAALMRLRTLRAHESRPIDEVMTEQGNVRFSDMLVDRRPNPEEVCVRREQLRMMNQGLRRLSRPQRRALSLHDFEGMTTREAANALGLSEGTVKSQVHRARQRLSQQVKKIQEARALPRLEAAA
jgi:RNA polymerase sigma-70 factor (ECF subfamily)